MFVSSSYLTTTSLQLTVFLLKLSFYDYLETNSCDSLPCDTSRSPGFGGQWGLCLHFHRTIYIWTLLKLYMRVWLPISINFLLTEILNLGILTLPKVLEHLQLVVWLLSWFYSLWLHGLRHARLPCPSLFPRVCSNSWSHTIITFSVAPFSTCLHFSPASGFFQNSWLFI